MSDNVNHPKHYTDMPFGMEVIDITENYNFCIGNALKYIFRAGKKGDAIEDLRKAIWYIRREIKNREEDCNLFDKFLDVIFEFFHLKRKEDCLMELSIYQYYTLNIGAALMFLGLGSRKRCEIGYLDEAVIWLNQEIERLQNARSENED